MGLGSRQADHDVLNHAVDRHLNLHSGVRLGPALHITRWINHVGLRSYGYARLLRPRDKRESAIGLRAPWRTGPAGQKALMSATTNGRSLQSGIGEPPNEKRPSCAALL